MFKLSKVKRLNRRSYVLNIIVGALILICLGGALALPTGALNEETSGNLLSALGTGAMILAVVSSWVLIIICTIYRLHDLDLSGWLSALILAPFVGGFFWLFIVFGSGKKSKNKWGSEPSGFDWLVVKTAK